MQDDPEAVQYHSLTGQSAYQDLLRLLKDAAVSDLRGTPTRKTVGARSYWYDRFRVGSEIVDRYVGEDAAELRDRLARHAKLRRTAQARERETARLVRLLKAEGYLAPDVGSGQILAALARAGAFRLGGTVVGTQAFRLYEGVLGVRIGSDRAAMTNDIDIASFERLSLALGDQVRPELAAVFAELKFEPLPALDPGRTWRWRQSRRQTLIEFLTPSFEAEEGLRDLPALGVSAQALHFLNFLIERPVAAPLLYRQGVLVQVPRPERYAIHKLIVADRRRLGEAALKARKDRAQAEFLVRVLAEETPDLLGEAHAEAVARGPAWRAALDRTLARMPETRERLEAVAG